MKKVVQKIEKEGITAQQFAEDSGTTLDRLLVQCADAEIPIKKGSDLVTEAHKQKLMHYLQKHHGAKQDTATEKFFVTRAKTSEIKLGGSRGGLGKTISIQVRKKRAYVKR